MATPSTPSVSIDDQRDSLPEATFRPAVGTEGEVSAITEAEAIVRRYYETVDTKDSGAVVDLFAPDAVYHRPGYQPMVGREALHRFYAGERVIACGRHVITQILTAGPGRLAVEGRFTGKLKDGTDVELGFADFFLLRSTLIAERTTYFAVSAV